MKSKIFFVVISLIFLIFAVSCDFNIDLPDVGRDLDESVTGEMNQGDGSEPASEDEKRDELDTESNLKTDPETDPETDSETVFETESEGEIQCQHGNVEEVAVTVSTCETPGYYNIVCRDCGDIVGSIESELEKHTEGNWFIEIDPTVEKRGLEITACTVCGERIERELDALGYSSGLLFTSNGDDTCAVVGRGSCSDRYIRVPPTSPDGCTVTAVGANAFEEDEKLVRVYLPDTVTLVGNDAFSMSTVEEIRLSDNVTVIGDNAFFGCDLLREIKLPQKLLEIGSNAFNSCRGLNEMQLPEGLESIGGGALSNCKNITKLHIPASVSYIGDAFISVAKVTEITVDENNTKYKIITNCLVDSDGLLIVGFGECYIPTGTVRIGRYAFIANTAMTSAMIPSSVREIGDFAFSMTGIEEVIIPYGVRTVGNGAFSSCEKLSKVVIPNTVNKIGYWVFDECGRLSSITYYGNATSWSAVDIHEDNEGLDTVTVIFIDEVSPDSVYGYGRTTISGNAVKLYDILVDAVMRDAPQNIISLNQSDKMTVEDFDLARQIFLSDYPECFWWRGTIGYYTNSEGYIKSIEFVYLYSGDDLVSMKAELEKEVSDIIAALPEGSVFDKALYLHNVVAERVTYTFTDNDQTPYGALVEGEAVCNGYATAYQLLLQRAGIRAWTVNGIAGDQNHAWNVVWLSEDVCVYTDVTWNDLQVTMHYYFNMSLDEIEADHFTSDDFILPDCNHTEYGYDDVSAECIVLSDSDSANKLRGRFVNNPEGGKTVQFYYVGTDFATWISKNSMLIKMMAGGGSISYMNSGNEYVVFVK